MKLGPRLVVAGVSSGVGKTTVATGLMAAFSRRGLRVAPAKVGPDFIDPGYHTLATGRAGRNLDAWMSGSDAIAPLASRAFTGADVLIVEGVMGLFDGAADGSPSSTADVAKLLDAPIVLVVDGSAMSGSVAALVHGFASFDREVQVAGVILNRVGSDSHESMLRAALAPVGVPVFGVLRRDDRLAWRSRHLGLVPVVEQLEETRAALDRLAVLMAAGCDLDAIERTARAAPLLDAVDLPPPRTGRSVRIAVPQGPAFGFVYPDNIEAFEQAGAEIVPFDPITDPVLPDGIGGLYVGGGFPEVFVDGLAANSALLSDVRGRVAGGLVTWAECGGMLWLGRSLDGRMLAGVIDIDSHMTDRRTLGYRQAAVQTATPVAPAGAMVRGHEFHYSTVTPAGDALLLEGRTGTTKAGFGSPTLLASYLHLHLGATPALAERFVATAASAVDDPANSVRIVSTSD